MDFREYLISELTDMEDIVKPFMKMKNVVRKSNADDNVIKEITNEEVMNYLVEHGYELTQENYNQAKSILERGGGQNHEYNLHTVEYENHLNDLTVEELKILINLAVLKDNRKSPQRIKYKYEIETVLDNSLAGGVSFVDIKKKINQYSEKGYRLIQIVTNEIGKVSSKNPLSEYNSKTVEQYILIFEKPMI